MNKRLSQIILVSVILMLSMPLLQKQTNLFNIEALKGAYKSHENVELSVEAWFNSEYQDAKSKYLKDHIGFKALLIRICNQIDYSFFSISHAKNVVMGKNNMLYQKFYIDAYYGKDYVGAEILEEKAKKLNKVQKELQKQGKKLLFIIAPGKASIYPENIPENLISPFETSNYDDVIKYFNQYQCEYIDLKPYIKSIKDTAQRPIFPRHGTHWSGYTLSIVADSVFKYLGANTKYKLNHYAIKEGESTNAYRYTDNDIGTTLNLLFRNTNENVYYPEILFKTTKDKKPNTLLIGDSFTQSFFGFYPFLDSLLSKQSNYWYYNKYETWPKRGKNVEDIDLGKNISERDIILIVSTEHNLHQTGFGFIENLYDIYFNPLQVYKNKIAQYKSNFKKKPKLMKMLKEKAKKNKSTLEHTINEDAKWLYKKALITDISDSITFHNKELNSEEIKRLSNTIAIQKIKTIESSIEANKEKEIRLQIEKIKKQKKLYKLIVEKARKNKLSVEEQLRKDALWIIENK